MATINDVVDGTSIIREIKTIVPQTYYEDRAKALDSIIEKFKQPSTFEDFLAAVYSPSQVTFLFF